MGGVCDSLGTDSLSLYVRNHWATYWLTLGQLVKGGIQAMLCLPTQGLNASYGSLSNVTNCLLYKLYRISDDLLISEQ